MYIDSDFYIKTTYSYVVIGKNIPNFEVMLELVIPRYKVDLILNFDYFPV